jgi:hypothetical protein
VGVEVGVVATGIVPVAVHVDGVVVWVPSC